jgi:hypothetical protein
VKVVNAQQRRNFMSEQDVAQNLIFTDVEDEARPVR